MKIKELEQALGITRANIRFYEEKGLVNPKRGNNNYREYTEEDIQKLQWVILLRKMDISIADIQKLSADEKQLNTILKAKQSELQSKINELQGVVALCEIMGGENISVKGTDPAKYLQLMEQQESAGKKFKDILGDIPKDYKRDILQVGYGPYSGMRLFINIVLATLLITGLEYFLIKESLQWSIFYPLAVVALTTLAYFVLKFIALKVKIVDTVLQKATREEIVFGILYITSYFVVDMLRPLLPFC